MPARLPRRFDMLVWRADAVRGCEQLVGGDDFVVGGAEQEDRVAQRGKIDPPPQRDEIAGGQPAPDQEARQELLRLQEPRECGCQAQGHLEQ